MGRIDSFERFQSRDDPSGLTIPDTIPNLTELESLSIRAFVETLPKSLCNLKKLEFLDLTGCYTILTIPSEILAMPNLKIKVGDVISPASEVVVIKIPRYKIDPDIFSVLSDGNKQKIWHLLIHQEPHSSKSDEDGYEEVVIPDNICPAEGIRSICLRGKVVKVPTWTFTQTNLSGCYSLESLPESIGQLNELTSLKLSGCMIKSLPESIGNLSNLTSLNLSGCENLESLPLSIDNLSKLASLDVSGCTNLKSRQIIQEEEEVLRIELPSGDEEEGYIYAEVYKVFEDKSRMNEIKHLIIEQNNYICYQQHNCIISSVTLPDTVANLTQLESITITARVEALPECVHFKKP